MSIADKIKVLRDLEKILFDQEIEIISHRPGKRTLSQRD